MFRLKQRHAPEDLPGAMDEHPIRFRTRHPRPTWNSAGLRALAGGEFDPGHALYVDVETTGLSTTPGTLAFLIGYGWVEGDEFVLEQLLLRNSGEEEALALVRLSEYVASAKALVTFNGRAFDVPLLQVRARLHHIALPFSGLPHLDLYPQSRRLFRPRMWSSRLVALEEGILGWHRAHAIPSHFIPSLYAEYLRSGDARPLAEVVAHNQQDILAMPRLLQVLTNRIAKPLEEADDADELVAIGRMHLHSGDPVLAGRCLERASELARLPATQRRASCALLQLQRARQTAPL